MIKFCVCQNIWMKYIKLQKNLGQQFKRETQYKDLPPIFRIRPPKSTSVLEQRDGASGLCELFNPTDDWWTFFVLASMLKCVGHVCLHVHPVVEGETNKIIVLWDISNPMDKLRSWLKVCCLKFWFCWWILCVIAKQSNPLLGSGDNVVETIWCKFC